MKLRIFPLVLKCLVMRSDSKMTFSEIMRSYCVMVNGGSGVLVNAMTNDYSYVLTAGHAVEADAATNVVTDHQGNNIEVLEVLPFPKVGRKNPLDCAVLKVAHQADVAQRSWAASDLPHRANLTVVGFPETERASAEPVKQWDGHSTSVADELIVFTVDGIPGVDVLKGISGGGVYHVDNGYPYLVGIEFKMEATRRGNQFGRVECHSLARFNEIVTAHSSAPMIPAHLECFSRMREMIFEFNVVEQRNVQDLKAALINIADSLISNGLPPPYEIMKKYKTQLLLDPKHAGELEVRALWVAYLEFVVISALMDNVGVTDGLYIEGIEKRRRLLYTSDTSNWIGRLEEVLKVARKLLDRNGTLIVASPDIAAKPFPPKFRLEGVISNISVVPNQGPLAIDNVEGELYSSFKLAHLEGLRSSCVIEQEDEYPKKFPGRQQLQHFRDKLNEIIT